ncbi:MAG: polysaccharide pyruvyl transferase family protein [Candidatus Omnitrophota bacterium]|jgi:hypothetical protein|nr:MAG: polysaccharide pyruvyl transferase family protein [Candidatus Omnitrophota bacterium]
MKKTLSLLHLANWNSTNIGNGALIDGTHTVLEEDLPLPIDWTPVAWDDYTFGLIPFDERFVELINESDGMIINGAVTINGREYLKNAGMRFDLPYALWSKIQKPLIFYGISYRHWSGQPFYHASQLRRSIEFILNSPLMIFGVRNDGTKEWLERQVGIASEKIVSIPDMGLFVTGEAGYFPQIRNQYKNLILAFNNEDAEYRYGIPARPSKTEENDVNPYRERRSDILKKIGHTVERLAAEWNLNMILVPHYFDDFSMVSEFVSHCRPQLAHQHMVSTGLLPVSATRHFYGFYSKADAAMSMRVHSMSPSIGLGIPMIPVITQERMRVYLKEAELSDWSIDAFSPHLEEQLYESLTTLLRNPESIQMRFAAARRRFREQCRAFNRKVAAILVQ